ncbi:hypothetical protein INR49_029063 [Caranx melampygus]|nr:hypothetical protein INR49_029063 [Caranx melampygus]
MQANLFLSWSEVLGQFGSRLLRGARVVPEFHGLNTAKLREQLSDHSLQDKAAAGVLYDCNSDCTLGRCRSNLLGRCPPAPHHRCLTSLPRESVGGEMAAALSRALKLPGKKGSELGEYDPLTQADSEDESEEDDLVLNYPRNGLGRDSCLGPGSSKLRGGRSGRLVGAKDEAQEDEEEEEDEWRERLPSKSRQDRDDMKGTQYWSQRDSGRDRVGEDRGGAGPLGGAGLVDHSTDAEEKRIRMKNAVRSAFFLVPLVCATMLVLLCAFLIPCQKGDLGKRPQWERALGDAGVYSAVALSALNGQVLWRKVIGEPVMSIQCGLQYSSQLSPVCLLISKSSLTAVNGTTGKNLSSVQLKNIESQAVLLPDLQGDSVPDLLVATLPADEALDLSLTLISGLTGHRSDVLYPSTSPDKES